ncbi:MAG: MBL fold metallo-hydrolase [Opitutus sp.]|nr:MBL fold metallo-hydrolase [Opitutus sp.]
MSLPPSDHFNGKTFFNRDHVNRSFVDVWRWKRTSRPARWPTLVPLVPQPAPPSARGDEIVITWIGHATFLLQTTRGNFLTDPQFSQRCGPFGLLGPKRVQPPGLALSALPRIDAILLSHDHYDHCDLASLRWLARRDQPRVITGLGMRSLVARAGLTRVDELDWWQQYPLSGDATATFTPARHWSNRLSGRRNARLWGGFHLRLGRTTAWFVGDSGYDTELFHRIREKLGAPDVAMIPIGAYEPRWFMAAQHCNPEEAVRIHLDVGARLSLAMHWGTWQLTDEGREDPPRALHIARELYHVSPEHFHTLEAGGSVVVDAAQ